MGAHASGVLRHGSTRDTRVPKFDRKHRIDAFLMIDYHRFIK